MIAMPANFGPHCYGANLFIDPAAWTLDTTKPIVVDVETNENDVFVGIGVCQSADTVYYFSSLSAELIKAVEQAPLVGHNLKFDIKQMIGWGFNIKPTNLYFDTCLASYVVNTTRESHSLKDLAKSILKMEWPTYKEMVGKGRLKETLDKQPTERVARYCGMDALATFRLFDFFAATMTPLQRRLLDTIELPVARVLMQMELAGVAVDVHYLKALDATFNLQMKQLEEQVVAMWHGTEPLNINSNRQVAELLEEQGAKLPTTKKGNKQVNKATLQGLQGIPAVLPLLEHSKIEKLWSTYTQGLLERQKGGRVYCSFNQITKSQGTEVGIHTGRLSSSNPNLQNIPARTEEGQKIMQAFVSEPGCDLLDADYSQIEPRILAHVSQDPFLLDVYNNEKDLYEELVRGTGRSRQDGKTFMLALLYGAQPKKLAAVFKCTEEEAEGILAAIWHKIPMVRAWVERTKFAARQQRGVYTLSRRFIPLPLINEGNRFDRLHWERVAVNAIIQGSAAEIMKKSLILLSDNGYVPVLTVHDSGLFNIKSDADAAKIKTIMESVVSLSVPLKVDWGRGQTWADAKL